ncbi:MAG: hypothetical protein GXW85_04735 [Clostridia bacterium]|nr:hypothetical protein [Clostridia bacterium]
MIDVNKMSVSAIDENLKKFIEVVTKNPSQNDFESEVRVYKALMNYSCLLLEKYHEALKSELAKYNIDI